MSVYLFVFIQAQTDHFKVYQQQVVKNAQTLAAALANKGYGIVSGGTDTHVVLLDLRAKVLYSVIIIRWHVFCRALLLNACISVGE